MTTYEPDRIFVGGLPATCSTDDQLGAFFNTIGAVKEAKVFVDLQTGRSKGFGFVRFEHPASVDAAIANDANNVIDGKWVSVKRCEQGGGQTKWPGGASSVEEAGLWVRGLPLEYTDAQLRHFFEQYGQVVDCKVLPRKYPNNPDAAGLVRMGSPEQAQWCLDNLNNTTPAGFPMELTIKFSSRSSSGGSTAHGGGGGGVGGRVAVAPHRSAAPQGDSSLTPEVVAQAVQLLANSGGSSDVIAAIANLASSGNDGRGGDSTYGHPANFSPNSPGGLPQESTASNRLWVRGLPKGYNDEMLKELFSQFGIVSDCKVLPQKYPQNPDMTGVVRMSTVEQAQWCIENVSGTQLPGCEVPILMRFARESGDGAMKQQQGLPQPQPQQVLRALSNNPNAVLNSAPPLVAPRSMSQGSGAAAPASTFLHQEGGKTYEPDRIFVGGLPHSCDTETLALFFSQFGSVVDASVNVDPASGKSKGFGFVRFQSVEAVELALLNDSNNIIDGKWVRVKRCELAGSQAAEAGSTRASTLGQQLAGVVSIAGGCGGASALAEGGTGVWIRGLPLEYNDASLQAFFAQYVEVLDCKILPRRYPNNPDQAGLVRLASPEMAQWCIDTLNGTQPPGFPLPISCKFSTSTAPVRPAGHGQPSEASPQLALQQSPSPQPGTLMQEAPQSVSPLPAPADAAIQARVSNIIASVVADSTAGQAPAPAWETVPPAMAPPEMALPASQPAGATGCYGDYGAPAPAPAFDPVVAAPPGGMNPGATGVAMDLGGEKRPFDGGYDDPQGKFPRM